MESRVEKAVEKKNNGMNCAQAIACTYCDVTGIDEETMAAITQGLGTGIGGTLEGTCGAITGACTVIGLLYKDTNNRMKAIQDARDIVNKFKERNSTVTCKELKGIKTGHILSTCNDCVRDAAEFLEQIIESQETQRIH